MMGEFFKSIIINEIQEPPYTVKKMFFYSEQFGAALLKINELGVVPRGSARKRIHERHGLGQSDE